MKTSLGTLCKWVASQLEKYQAVVSELERSEHRLEEMLSLATKVGSNADADDDLDAYMSTLQQAPVDKLELKKLKVHSIVVECRLFIT